MQSRVSGKLLPSHGRGLSAAISTLLTEAVSSAFDRLLAGLGGSYEDNAPASVGLAQYPGGESMYRRLVRQHATFEADPETVHRDGG